MRAMRAICISSLLPLAACAAHQDLVDGKEVSLEDAIRDTVKALAAAKEEGAKQKTNFGIYACTVTAEFKLSATANADDKLSLGVTGGPPASIAPVSVNLTGSQETSE